MPVKKTARKKAAPIAPIAKPYQMPMTAAEQGISRLSDMNGAPCGAAVIWFDYQLGEKEFYKGFVCDDHKVSKRLENLGQPKATKITV